MTSSSASLHDLTSDGSGSGIQKSKHGNVDDFNPNLYYGEDEWLDTYYDDIVYDDFAVLESQFDHMDIPSGVEAPFPWLSNPENDTKVQLTRTFTN